MKKISSKQIKRAALTALVFICIFSVIFPERFLPGPKVKYEEELSESLMSFHVIDVSQGSSCLIKTKNSTVLIDTGESFEGKKLLDYLKRENVESIDLLVITHPHSDHFGGAKKVLEEYPVRSVMLPRIDPKFKPQRDDWTETVKAVYAEKAKVIMPSEKETFILDENVEMELLGPFLKDPKKLNDVSLTFKINAGDVSILITGDGEKETEKALLKENIDSDVLIAGHHGSKTSSNEKFLEKVTPDLSVISCGKGNSHSLPDGEVMKRLLKYGDVIRTDISGSAVLFTDGKNIYVRPEKSF